MIRKFLCGSASVLALVLAGGAAYGQDNAPVENVTVTGVRASLGNALDIKKDAAQVQDSIVAEDIGKLPDNTVVEALQHVSGISILRNSVEPSTVLIRGLPDIATLLNGRQIFSTTGRFISLPDLPAELLARVDVHKASSATDLEGGIAGLIDVRLHRPFDFDGLEIAGGVQANDTSLANHVDGQGSFLISNRWNTSIGEIGALLDVSYNKRFNHEDQVTTGQRTNLSAGPVAGSTDNSPVVTCTTAAAATPGVVGSGCPTSNLTAATGIRKGYAALPNTVTDFIREGSIERSSLNGSLQWRPSDTVEAYTEIFYSRLRQKAPTDVDVFLDGTCNNPGKTSVYPGTNIANSFTSGCYSLTSIQDLRQKEDTYQVASGATWNATKNLIFSTELDVTVSNFRSTNFIPDGQYNLPADGLSISQLGDGGTRSTQVGDPQLNPNGIYVDQFYDQLNVRRGSEIDWRADGTYAFAPDEFIKSIDFGYRWTRRAAKNRQPSNSGLNCSNTTGDGSLPYNQYRLDAINSPACSSFRAQSGPQPFTGGYTSVGGVSLAAINSGAYHQTHGSFFGGKYGVSSWVNADPEYLVANAEQFRNLFGYSGPQAFVPTNSFDVVEQSDAGYMKANYGFDIFGLPVDGNIGFRLVNTSLTENAYTQTYVPLNPLVSSTQGANATCTTCVVYSPTTAIKNTSDFLPSVNVRVTLDDGLFLRIGASKTVTRPTFLQLNPGLNLSAPTATLLGTAASGNPNLAPERSTNVDVDGEYYWGDANHVSLALFHREVTGYIQNVGSVITIAGQNYNLTAPANVQNADIDGAEFGYSQFLDFLPGFWSGFGWDVNGTYVNGVFNNLAKYHFNGAGIYEQGPYSVRLSYTWNSTYKIGSFVGGVQPQFNYAAPRENADFSFNYKWDDQITLTFDITNLLNSYQKEYAGQGSINRMLYPTQIERFDQTFSIGIRYRM
ncbi:MAG TPA: TonB-dependent receptor [Rhizomicrobium sp.]|jgi:TonB-dependent receptor